MTTKNTLRAPRGQKPAARDASAELSKRGHFSQKFLKFPLSNWGGTQHITVGDYFL